MKKWGRGRIFLHLGILCLGAATGSLIGSGFESPSLFARDIAVLGVIFLLIAWRLRA